MRNDEIKTTGERARTGGIESGRGGEELAISKVGGVLPCSQRCVCYPPPRTYPPAPVSSLL